MTEELKPWTQEKIQGFQTDFLTWYYAERRLLPWRESRNPYSIWVSEIMLQQTQVVTVIPYYHRFLEWFPTIRALAGAPEEQLLKAWEGLGYYSRVRNMQAAAQQMVAQHEGEMPRTLPEILALKGIGPYTAGAIASIAFDLAEPAIDGNVMRVFSRLFEISEDIAKPASRKIFDTRVRQVISHEDPSSFNQAIMDLGATICTPTSPKCDLCPLQAYCGAYAAETVFNYPVKAKKVKARPVYYLAQVIQNGRGEVLLQQRDSEGLLANMWTFPLIEVSAEVYQGIQTSAAHYQQQQEAQLSLDIVAEAGASLGDYLVASDAVSQSVVWQTQPVGEIQHLFSHLKWHVSVAYGRLKETAAVPLSAGTAWIKPEDFDAYPFPKPQQKMLALLHKKGFLS